MEALKETWASWRRRTPLLVIVINVAGWLLVLGLCIASALFGDALPALRKPTTVVTPSPTAAATPSPIPVEPLDVEQWQIALTE